MAESLRLVKCCQCDVQFGLADHTYRTAKEKAEKFTFYCPHGHPQHYVSGETEEAKLRRERDLLRQQLAQKDDEIGAERLRRDAAERLAASRKGQVTRLKNRAAAGVCPCCTRSFENLRRHMSAKHPGFKAEEA